MPYRDPEARHEYEKNRYQDPERRVKKQGYDTKYRRKEGWKEYQANYYKENKERLDKQNMEWYNAHKESELEKRWERQIYNKFGLKVEHYNQMCFHQDYKCAICGTDKPGKRAKKWHIDHCHETGLVRGLLCHSCNIGLGHFKDNIELLDKAKIYLERRTITTVNREKLGVEKQWT